ncbi:MAG: hypothetical protein ACE5KD_00895 [Candidatus Bathyarchaeia archaeon]
MKPNKTKQKIKATISRDKKRGKYELRLEENTEKVEAVAEYWDTDLKTILEIINTGVMELKWEEFHERKD